MMLDLIGVIPGWYADAACARSGIDPEAFFPDPGKHNERDAATALRFCRRLCEVREQCAVYAIRNEIDHGIWGGLTAHQRRRMVGRQVKETPAHSPGGPIPRRAS